ncbi:hypothetical protein [Sphingorhabdus sp. Alg239-R122]|uniref:hypothetical protein n=1 Tax=Sphingorhabdus sp. Alg239-R122 TaxID=2305989 RepID=UPI0013DC5753|nr:hypothetical protein [Sphingorhabdus sp. Alg239-R122]
MNMLAEFTAPAGRTLAPTNTALNTKAETAARTEDWNLLTLVILISFIEFPHHHDEVTNSIAQPVPVLVFSIKTLAYVILHFTEYLLNTKCW